MWIYDYLKIKKKLLEKTSRFLFIMFIICLSSLTYIIIITFNSFSILSSVWFDWFFSFTMVTFFLLFACLEFFKIRLQTYWTLVCTGYFSMSINILLLCSGIELNYIQIRGKLYISGALSLQVLSFQVLSPANSRHPDFLDLPPPLPQLRETTKLCSHHPQTHVTA